MLLALDIGNTNIVVGVFDGERLLHSWRLSTLRQRTADEMGIWLVQLFQHRGLDAGQVDAIVMASVVPTLTRPTVERARRYFDRDPLVIDGGVDILGRQLAVLEQLQRPHAHLVRRPLALRGQAPAVQQALAGEDPDDDVGVADVES